MSDFSVTFILPCKNGERDLKPCLDSIQDVRRDGDRVIVVDNGSTDNTAAVARSYDGVEVLASGANSISGVRNDGARLADGDWFAFIDSDCVLCDGWRRELEATIANDAIKCTGSTVTIPDQSTWLERAWLCGSSNIEGIVKDIPSANLVIEAEAFRKIDGFDEALETDEDTDICWRLRKTFGEDIIYANPRMQAAHLGNAKTLRQHWQRQYWHATGLLSFGQRHGVDRALLMTFAFIVLHVVGISALVWLSGWPAPVMAVAAILLIPTITALYRATDSTCTKYVIPLVILYLMFYYARTVRMAVDILRGSHDQ